MLRNRSCPAVSQICILMVREFRPCTVRILKSTPIVDRYTLFGKFADTSELVVRDRYQHWWLRRGQKMSEMKFYIFWSNQYFVLPPPASMTAHGVHQTWNCVAVQFGPCKLKSRPVLVHRLRILALHISSQHRPHMFNRIQIRTVRRPWIEPKNMCI